MVKVKYKYIQFCYGNDRDYYRKPKSKEIEFSNEDEAQKFVDNLNRINKLPNHDKYENIIIAKMKKVKCKKQYGVWYYEKIIPEKYGTSVLDAPIYVLEKEDKTDGGQFGSYGDMKYYIETGVII